LILLVLQVTYQYCDMHDLPGVEELLQSAAVDSECNVSHGWFPPRVLPIIRRALQQRVSKWVRSAMMTSAGSTAHDVHEYVLFVCNTNLATN
jgi:hypothetical protein